MPDWYRRRNTTILALGVLGGLLSCLAPFPVGIAAEVTAERSEHGVEVFVDGTLFAEYRIDCGPQPAIWPIVGPTGQRMTRSYPVGPTEAHEEEDHPHHHSLWFAHGIVNDHDFWLNPQVKEVDGLKNGIVHRDFLKVESKGNTAVVEASNDWNSGGAKICEDVRTVVFGADEDARWIDFTIKLKASEGDVTFGDTKEGTFAVRMAGTMKVDAKLGGVIVNSSGQKDADAWGQPAEWVDYCGPVSDETVGIAIFSHPSNFRHPCLWHVRNYGLFAANPFGDSQFPKSDVHQGAFTIAAGDTLSLRYRAVFHRHDTKRADIEGRYRQFVRKPLQ